MVLCVLLAFAGSVWSYSVTVGSDIIDVGGLDALIASDNPGSGDATALAWVQTETGVFDLVMDEKYEDGAMSWLPTNTGGVYAIHLNHPTYFLVKTGNGSSTGNDHFLFNNLASLDWGVVNLVDLGLTSTNIGKISHVGEFNGTSVPEPLTVVLLGLGLVGLGGARRFQK